MQSRPGVPRASGFGAMQNLKRRPLLFPTDGRRKVTGPVVSSHATRWDGTALLDFCTPCPFSCWRHVAKNSTASPRVLPAARLSLPASLYRSGLFVLRTPQLPGRDPRPFVFRQSSPVLSLSLACLTLLLPLCCCALCCAVQQ